MSEREEPIMRTCAMIALSVLALASRLPAAAPPVTRPAKAPATRPTTAPARVDPAFVADFNEHLLNAKFDDVVAKLRELGALAGEPTLISKGRGKFPRDIYSVQLGYTWEYGQYIFTVDQAGKVYQFDFQPGQFPSPEYDAKLKPGNKWWIVKATTYIRADAKTVGIDRVQARTADEAGKEVVTKRRQNAKKIAKMPGQPAGAEEWLAKAEDVEVHEAFTPQLKARKAERVD